MNFFDLVTWNLIVYEWFTWQAPLTSSLLSFGHRGSPSWLSFLVASWLGTPHRVRPRAGKPSQVLGSPPGFFRRASH